MSIISYPNLDGYRTDGSTGSDVVQSFTSGDPASLNIWDVGWQAAFKALNWLLGATANGQLLIGNNSTGRFVKAVPTGSGGITVTAGAGTLAFSIASAAIATDRLSADARAQYITAIAELDLNAASATIPIGLITRAATITAINYVYSIASGAGTGVTVQVGKQGSAAFFATSTSAASQSQYTVASQTVLNSGAVAANDVLICSTTGSVATTGGKILVCIELATN